MQTVYLCGPMAGMVFEDCDGWRSEAIERIEGILDATGNRMYKVLSPTRGKKRWLSGKKLSSADLDGGGWEQPVFRRDHYDVKRSNILLCNLNDFASATASIGSMFEMAWGYDDGKFLLTVLTQDRENPHWHAFVRQASSVILPTMEDAYSYLENVLNS